jgi:hypothetical protein
VLSVRPRRPRVEQRDAAPGDVIDEQHRRRLRRDDGTQESLALSSGSSRGIVPVKRQEVERRRSATASGDASGRRTAEHTMSPSRLALRTGSAVPDRGSERDDRLEHVLIARDEARRAVLDVRDGAEAVELRLEDPVGVVERRV